MKSVPVEAAVGPFRVLSFVVDEKGTGCVLDDGRYFDEKLLFAGKEAVETDMAAKAEEKRIATDTHGQTQTGEPK